MLMYSKLFFSLAVLPLASNDLLPKTETPKATYFIVQDALGFGAISDGKKVIVSWTSPNERSCDYFTVEKSRDGVNFVSAAMTKGAGMFSSYIDYTDIDYCPFNGISYYRLKQTDYHGQVAYSQAIEVNYQILKDGSVIPKTGNLPDEAELKEMENKTILVLMKDKTGKDIVTKIRVSSENNALVARDFNENLEQGTYLVLASSYNPLCGQKVLVK